MVNTTEGVIFTTCQKGGIEKLPEHIEQQLDHKNAEIYSLPKISRQQFVVDVKKAVGDVADVNIPVSIMPTLKLLLTASEDYIETGDEQRIQELCKQAIDLCGQGWSYLSYWTSTEQSICYSIFWGLKAAVEKHDKCMNMYRGSKNDGLPQNDAPPPSDPDPKIALIRDWLNKRRRNKATVGQSTGLFKSKLFAKLGGNSHKTVESFNPFACHGLQSMDELAVVKSKIHPDKKLWPHQD